MEQTAREGFRHASASHATRSASSTGSGDRSVPLPVEDPVQKECTADANAARLGFAQALQLTDPHTRMVVAARGDLGGDALFGLADLGLGQCEKPASL